MAGAQTCDQRSEENSLEKGRPICGSEENGANHRTFLEGWMGESGVKSTRNLVVPCRLTSFIRYNLFILLLYHLTLYKRAEM